ncbi:carbohydrate kinase family protein [Dyadobacter tibetensis]|uniref:carbohydrate kinase family protein n=1 Tax=Dyadobacter tibetensis TaxID=1211851 RepID=UPI0004710C90|nr:carbohydrate kinase [Dyadobacter tibetensis]
MTPKVVIFGEMLWDMLPSGKQPGGAPMNVAIHLKNFGGAPILISRIGSDDLGEELMHYLESQGLPTQLVQTGTTHLTGIVKVNLSDKTEVTYKIVQPVAWDYIHLTPENIELVTQADVFLYGSLAARGAQSKETLLHLLSVAKLKVFDVNLRPPYFDQPAIEELLYRADIVKLNENELSLIATWYGLEDDFEAQIKDLIARFQLQMVCVTLGANGAIVVHQDRVYRQHGFPVEVQDTIGSGDSFLAMFLHLFLEGVSIPEALCKACGVGALVATHQGATPTISEQMLVDFLKIKHQTSC